MGLDKKLLVCLVGLLLVFPSSSYAQYAIPVDSQTWAEVTLAKSFWQERNLTTQCSQINVGLVAGLMEDHKASGVNNGPCSFVYDPIIAWKARFGPRHRWWFKWECTTVFHEMGHIYGLGHNPIGVRGIMGQRFEDIEIPWNCKIFVRYIMRLYG